jgi:hypothetical protein
MGRYDRLCGDEDEIDYEFRIIQEERYQALGDEENEDWYCNQFEQPLEMVIADR